jgi:hypothetical protein
VVPFLVRVLEERPTPTRGRSQAGDRQLKLHAGRDNFSRAHRCPT